MDNMLYIIAGLIIILVIGVWILRRNKAQRPTSQPISQENALHSVAPIQYAASNSANTATMFDDITVAQRFIDQQRYDKAVETLERGLSQKPNDSALSLKLLNVYALSSDNVAFYDTYNSIIAHGDIVTITQARQLRELIDEDENQALDSLIKTGEEAAYESIDFDKNLQSIDNRTEVKNELQIKTKDEVPIVSYQTLDANISDIFDLTLDDLEATDETPIKAIETEPVFLLDTENNTDVLDSDVLDSVVTQSPDKNLEIVTTDEPILDFDSLENSYEIQSIADSTVTNKADVYNEDDFELDFDNLLDDAAFKDSQTGQVEVQSNDDFVLNFDQSSDLGDQSLTLDIDSKPSMSSNLESVDNDLLLFLDEVTDNNSLDEITANLKAETTEDFANHPFSFTADNGLELDTLDSVALADTINKSQASEIPLTFSDDSDIEAFEFNIDSPEQVIEPLSALGKIEATSSPVLLDETKDTDLSASFAAQFAADFEFVDTLDSQQITLDLAGQYLQLGEYDSANRLLNEVVAQGNPEQQQQAQALLARSA